MIVKGVAMRLKLASCKVQLGLKVPVEIGVKRVSSAVEIHGNVVFFKFNMLNPKIKTPF